MNTNKKMFIAMLILVIGFSAIFTVSLLTQKIKLNEGNVVGNTAGNINNEGLFCESEGVVYFSNPYDGGCLYSMTPQETDFKKLTTAGVSYINADTNYLYYYLDSADKGEGLGYVQRTYGIYRSRLNGKDTECLKRDNAIAMQLCGNYLYYQFFDNDNTLGTQLYKIKIDKSEDVRVADFNINPACCVNGLIYYGGTKEDSSLYTLDTATGSSSLVLEGNIWNPVYLNDYIYYMDASRSYKLCRYSMSQNIVEILCDDRVDFFNVYENYIYYQKSSESEPALKRMYTDGSSPEIVASGIYKNINITSSYVYFRSYDVNDIMYKTPVNGAVQVTTFDAAQSAAEAK